MSKIWYWNGMLPHFQAPIIFCHTMMVTCDTQGKSVHEHFLSPSVTHSSTYYWHSMKSLLWLGVPPPMAVLLLRSLGGDGEDIGHYLD